jgi:hypothetical protein
MQKSFKNPLNILYLKDLLAYSITVKVMLFFVQRGTYKSDGAMAAHRAKRVRVVLDLKIASYGFSHNWPRSFQSEKSFLKIDKNRSTVM